VAWLCYGASYKLSLLLFLHIHSRFLGFEQINSFGGDLEGIALAAIKLLFCRFLGTAIIKTLGGLTHLRISKTPGNIYKSQEILIISHATLHAQPHMILNT